MKALIVLGGDAPSCALLKACAEACDFSIAADRGLEAFDAAGLVPDLLLGDMDSVQPGVLSKYEGHLSLKRLPCVKDDTDGEHALHTAIERGAKEIILLGALGGRLDHAMANVMLLVSAGRRDVMACILDEQVRIRCVGRRAVIAGAQGDTLSLLPLGAVHGVRIRGCYYPLDGHTMTSDNSLGISNVITHDPAEITTEDGDLILFHYYKDGFVKE